jgi:hypothetical protein
VTSLAEDRERERKREREREREREGMRGNENKSDNLKDREMVKRREREIHQFRLEMIKLFLILSICLFFLNTD